jgi:hypothetical protein
MAEDLLIRLGNRIRKLRKKRGGGCGAGEAECFHPQLGFDGERAEGFPFAAFLATVNRVCYASHMGKCIFCSREAELTGEHIWSAWTARLLAPHVMWPPPKHFVDSVSFNGGCFKG